MQALKEFANLINVNMANLAATYARLLADSHPGFAVVSKDNRITAGRKLLKAAVTACEQQSSAPLLTYFNDNTPRWSKQTTPLDPLTEIECLGQTLTPVVTNLEAGKFLWQALFETRAALSHKKPAAPLLTGPSGTDEQVVSEHKLLRQLIDLLPDHIYIKDTQSRFLLVNDVVRRHLGAETFEQVVGKTDFDFSPSELAQQYHAAEQTLLQSGQALVGFEEPIYDHETNSTRWVSTTKVPFYDAQGNLAGLVGLNRDITAIKTAEQSRSQADFVIKNSPVMMFRWRAAENWPVEYVSDNVAQFGYTPAELMSGATPYASIVHPDDLQRVAEEVQAYSASGVDQFTQEYRLITKDGQVRWTDDRTVIERDEAGNITHYQGIIIDITERKQAEEAVKQNETRLSEAAALAKLYYWEFDIGLQKFVFSPEYFELLGLPVVEGKDCIISAQDYAGNYVHPDDAPVVAQEIQTALTSPDPNYSHQLESRNIIPGGQIITMLVRYYKITNAQGQPIKLIGVNQDITDRKQAEAAQKQLMGELAQERSTLQAILESLPLGVFVVEAPTGKPLVANAGAIDLLGQGIDPNAATEDLAEVYQAYRYGTDELYPPDQMPLVQGMFGQSTTVADMEVRKPDGQRQLLEVFGAPIKNANGDITSSVAIFQDITQRRAAEEMVIKRAEELQTVVQVSTSVAVILDEQKVLEEVVNLTKSRFGLYHAHIYLLNDSSNTLKLAAGAGEAGQQMVAKGWSIPLEQEHSLVAQAARLRHGVIANDVRQNPDFLPNPLLPDTRSEMAIPLIIGERVLGVLDVQADRIDRFTDEDVQIKTILASQVATALDNARLLNLTRRRARREQTIREITDRMRSATSLEQLMKTTVEELGQRLQAEYALVDLDADQTVTSVHQQTNGR